MKHEITFMKYFYLISIQHSLRMCRSSQQRCSVRNVVLEISQNLQKKTNLCQNLIFNKVAGLRPATLLKKRPWHWCFPVNFVKFPRTPLSQNTSGRLLLYVSHRKKNVITEKRYRVKFDSIKKSLLFIKQKQKNSKIPKRIRMKSCSKTRSGKSACADIFVDLSLTI